MVVRRARETRSRAFQSVLGESVLGENVGYEIETDHRGNEDSHANESTRGEANGLSIPLYVGRCRSRWSSARLDVRCIKPNEHQTPDEWNSSSVLEQIKYLGLVANIDVRKTGFVYRREFNQFLDR